ncbi:MAG: glycosyltransferase [Pseudomonadota bacterium]
MGQTSKAGKLDDRHRALQPNADRKHARQSQPCVLLINRFGAALSASAHGLTKRSSMPPTGRLAGDLATMLSETGFEPELLADDVTRQPRSRILGYGRLAWRALWRLGGLRRHDQVAAMVVMSDPPMILVVMALIGRLFRVPVIYWCQDVYPDVIVGQVRPGRGLAQLLLKPLAMMHHWAMAQSAGVIVPSPCIKQRLLAAGFQGPVEVMSNWPERGLRPAASKGCSVTHGHRLRLLYSGHYGQAHDLTDLVAAARLMNDKGMPIDVHITLSERGLARFHRRHQGAQLLDNVTVGRQVSEINLQDHLAGPDMHVVSVRPGAEGAIFPCKALAAMRIGRPILLFGTGESSLASLIDTHNAGKVVLPGMSEDLVGWFETVLHHAVDRPLDVSLDLPLLGQNALAAGRALGFDQGPTKLVSTVADAALQMPGPTQLAPIFEVS